ncbi:MAG: hypothetical protein V3T58_00180 [Candidatus Hydrothermarchaeales archaeon]
MLSLIGIGGAGCKVVESFYRKDLLSSLISKLSKGGGIAKGVAIDTSDALTSMDSIPLRSRVLIGSSRAKGHGTGGDIELGKKIMQEESELAMNTIRKVNLKKPEIFFLIAGLGGGTGTGGYPFIAERLRFIYNVPIIGVLMLPSKAEGTLYLKNTYANLARIIDLVDGAIVFDNNVLTEHGEDIFSAYKIINEAIFKFLSTIDSAKILEIARDKIATAGYMRLKAEHISIKDILDKMLKDHIFLSMEKAEKLHLIIYGDLSNVYGQSFAKEWVKGRFGCEVDYVFRDEPHSKYLNIGLMITGLKDIAQRFEIQEGVEKASSELEDLLGDIKPLF